MSILTDVLTVLVMAAVIVAVPVLTMKIVEIAFLTERKIRQALYRTPKEGK